MTRRDLIKMGLLGTGGLVLLREGGGFGRVSSAFDNQQHSPVLQPFVDPLPTLNDLTEVPPLTQITDYAGYKSEFLRLFGFARADVNYDEDVSPDVHFDCIEP